MYKKGIVAFLLMLKAPRLSKVMVHKSVFIQYMHHFVLLHPNAPLVVDMRKCVSSSRKYKCFIPEQVTLEPENVQNSVEMFAYIGSLEWH
jgi:hypothetical protein